MSSSPTSIIQPSAAERKARNFWTSLIVGLLSLQVVIGITSIVLSVGDPTVSVVPNYHQTALNWDTLHRAQVLTQSLGWQIDTTVGERATATSGRVLKIGVRDRSGNYVRGLRITAQHFHHARGSEVYSVALVEGADGRYAATTKLDRAGLWQIDLQIESEHGIARVSQELEIK